MAGRRETQEIPHAAQLELPVGRQRVPDRNFERGGRSFYFFDFDDNVVFLKTRIFLFERETGEEIALSTRDFAEISGLVGKPGPWEAYELRDDERSGSFRRFRDVPAAQRNGQPQPFVEDLLATIGRGDLWWKAPSWSLFDHAVFNQRPVAIITARGHHPDTVKQGIHILCRDGHLAQPPNYLGVYTVTHPDVRRCLGDTDDTKTIPELKKAAIVDSVREAMKRYGENPYHRFGMSDDDPHNVALILEAMTELKQRHPRNAFFVIDTSQRPVIKTEVLVGSTAESEVDQLTLFD
jgi:hypothetical protein